MMNERSRIRAGIFLLFCFAVFCVCSAPGQKPLSILLSNDDGIEAPGLAALFDSLLELGTVTVAAAVENRSGTSHGVTSREPIAVRESEREGMKWYGIDALPATCVRLAVENLLPERPDFVIAGINAGANLGTVAFYSATVACAREAAFVGIPAVSVNIDVGPQTDYAAAAGFVKALVARLAADGMPKGTYLNVNVPALPRDRIKGVRITVQDTRAPLEFYEKRTGPGGETVFIPSYKHLDPAGENTDIWAVRNGYISITPFTIDQTDGPGLKGMKPLETMDWK